MGKSLIEERKKHEELALVRNHLAIKHELKELIAKAFSEGMDEASEFEEINVNERLEDLFKAFEGHWVDLK